MKVEIELDEKHCDLLSITAVGHNNLAHICVATYLMDLRKGQYLKIDENGRGWQSEQPVAKED